MSASVISDPNARASVAALSAAVDVEASKARVAAGAVNDAERRLRELKTLLADHDCAEPSAVPAVADDLAAQLAADPAAVARTDWTGQLDDAQAILAARRSAWESKRVIIERSVASVQAELPTLEAARDEARRRHERAWSTFVWTAHGALMVEFEREFVELRDRLLLPIDALTAARTIYGGAPLPYQGASTIHGDTAVDLLIAAEQTGFGRVGRRLYPQRDANLTGIVDRLRIEIAD